MAGRDAFGSVFKRGDGGSPTEVFSELANVRSIGGPNRTRATIDVTAHDSADQYMEYLGGLKDGGQVTLDLNYDPTETSHEQLDDDFEDVDPRNYQILILPDTVDEHTWTVSAIITALGDSFPHDDRASRSVTLKITGRPELVHTAGS